MKFGRRWVAMAGLALLTGCSTDQPSCTPQPGLELEAMDIGMGAVPGILAGVNGVPAGLIFDTGAETSVLSPAIAARAHLYFPAENANFHLTGVGGTEQADIATVQDFRLTGARIQNASFVVGKLISAKFAARTGVDGAFGEDFLVNYDLDLNLPDGFITLRPIARCQTVLPPWPGPAVSVPIQFMRSGRIVVPVSLDGHPFTALLDTGAAYSDIDSAAMEDTKIKPQRIGNPLSLAGVGGETTSRPALFTDMKIGTLDLGQVSLLVAVPADLNSPKTRRYAQAMRARDAATDLVDPYADEEPPSQFDPSFQMTLGEDFLTQHRIYISRASHTLLIAPRQTP